MCRFTIPSADAARRTDCDRLSRTERLAGATFTSASTVHSFAEAVGRENVRGLNALCIGSVTAEAAAAYEMKPYTAQEATETALLALCKTVLEG